MKTYTKEELLKQKADIDKQLEELEKKEVKGFVIKSRYSNSEIYVSKSNNVKDAVMEAVKGRADLREADLKEADLGGADLREADLRGADLSEADFWGADLSEADFWGADLSEADLGEAKFYGKGGTQKLKKNQVEVFLKALGFEVEE